MAILRSLLSAVAAYVPTEWVTGDTITADRLNHMEEGIENAAESNDYVVLFTEIPGSQITVTADKTYSEINEAIQSGKNVFGKRRQGEYEPFSKLYLTCWFENGPIFFVNGYYENGSFSLVQIRVNTNDSVEYNQQELVAANT